MCKVSLDDIIVTSLQRIPTFGGNVLHALKKSDAGFNEFGEVYFSWIENKCIKAWKCHQRMTLNLVVPVGKVNFVFHSTKEYSQLMQSFVKASNLSNCEIVSDDKIKSHILQKSIFAVAKSGTVSLEICNAKIPLIILYKMGFINFLIVKILVKTKYANIINFAADEEIIPELLQSNCNSKTIFKYVDSFLDNPNKIKQQVEKVQNVLNKLKTEKSSSELASLSLNKFL